VYEARDEADEGVDRALLLRGRRRLRVGLHSVGPGALGLRSKDASILVARLLQQVLQPLICV
jgi:hypothetical protein